MEVGVARLDRRSKRLGVHPGQHEHSSVGPILDDRRDQAGRRERDVGEGQVVGGCLRRSRDGLRHEADGESGRGHRGLHVGDRVDPPMEDRGRQDGVRAALDDRPDEVVRPGGPT